MKIQHRFGPIRFERVGRLLHWREGVGYASSDLSRRGVTVGFPHVYHYHVRPTEEGCCRLHLTVRGRWTALCLPRGLIRAWQWWVMSQAALHLPMALYRYARLLNRRAQADGTAERSASLLRL